MGLMLTGTKAYATVPAPRARVSVSGPFPVDEAVQWCVVLRTVLQQAGAEPEGCETVPPADGVPGAPDSPQLIITLEGQRTGLATLRVRHLPRDPLIPDVSFHLPPSPPDVRRAAVISRLQAVLSEPPYRPLANDGLTLRPLAFRHRRAPTAFRLVARLRPDKGPPPDVLGAALDVGVLLTFATVQYALDPSTNAQDWKLDYSFHSLGLKLTFQDFEFDDNAFRLNSGHVLSGTYYFLSARSRNLDVFQSFLLAMAAALTWEMTTEFREVLSVNDVVMTPLGGLALGEALYQLSTFFRASEDTFWNQLLADLLAGPARLVWHRNPSPPGDVRLLDARGVAADRWHRFHLFVGLDAVNAGDALALRGGPGFAFGVDTLVVPRADYDRPGDTAGWTQETLATRLRARASLGEQGLRNLWILARSDYLGYYAQHLRPWGQGLWGLSAYAGLGASLEYEEEQVRPFVDQLTAASPVGVSAHVVFHAGPLILRTGAELHPVFAQIHSAAWPSYLEGGGNENSAFDVLKAHGYYYALGLRPAFRAWVEYRSFELGMEQWAYSLRAVDALAHPASHAGPYLEDERLTRSAWLACPLPGHDLRLVLSLDSARRSGRVGFTHVDQPELHALLRLDWTL